MLREVLSYHYVSRARCRDANLSSTMFILAMDMKEALVSLGKIRILDLFAQASLMKCKHEI